MSDNQKIILWSDNIEHMREWFFDNYEDPAERTPYNAAEGGYLYIHGGPFDAKTELQNWFSSEVPEEDITQLSEELDDLCWGWTYKSNAEDYDNFLIDDIALTSEYHSNFINAIVDIYNLLDIHVENSAANCFYRLLYVNAITALETYLSDAFISTVVPNPDLMRKFIEATPVFKDEKFSMSEVYKAVESINQKAKSHLADVVWHNLHHVIPMYRDTLNVNFSEEKNHIFLAIRNRHDIVHRNGKTKSGEDLVVSKQDVKNIISMIEKLILDIEIQLNF